MHFTYQYTGAIPETSQWTTVLPQGKSGDFFKSANKLVDTWKF